jgi:hypothetical protein
MRHAYNLDLPLDAAERAQDRFPTDFHADVVDDRGASVRVRVRNLSCLGFMGESPSTLRIGSSIWLQTSGHVHKARVHWELQGRFGCAFDQEIGWADVLRLVAKTD